MIVMTSFPLFCFTLGITHTIFRKTSTFHIFLVNLSLSVEVSDVKRLQGIKNLKRTIGENTKKQAKNNWVHSESIVTVVLITKKGYKGDFF